MESIMLSTRPRWVEIIADGRKRIEVRKSKPQEKPPFRCFIYACLVGFRDRSKLVPIEPLFHITTPQKPVRVSQTLPTELMRTSEWMLCNGSVIGEFVCDEILEFEKTKGGVAFRRFSALHETCLSLDEIRQYFGKKQIIYGWHIANLKIYDQPKKLNEFRTQAGKVMTRPPQSWCYIEKK